MQGIMSIFSKLRIKMDAIRSEFAAILKNERSTSTNVDTINE